MAKKRSEPTGGQKDITRGGADRLTLSDMVNATGLLTIFLIVVQSVMPRHIYDTMGNERLSRLLDRVSFAVLLIGYAAVNPALPLSARPL